MKMVENYLQFPEIFTVNIIVLLKATLNSGKNEKYITGGRL